jgi:hypothetical protein
MFNQAKLTPIINRNIPEDKRKSGLYFDDFLLLMYNINEDVMGWAAYQPAQRDIDIRDREIDKIIETHHRDHSHTAGPAASQPRQPSASGHAASQSRQTSASGRAPSQSRQTSASGRSRSPRASGPATSQYRQPSASGHAASQSRQTSASSGHAAASQSRQTSASGQVASQYRQPSAKYGNSGRR